MLNMILQFILLVLSFLSFFPWIQIFRIGSRFLFNLDLDSGKKFNPNPEKKPGSETLHYPSVMDSEEIIPDPDPNNII